MLNAQEIELAVELQGKSYALLKWVASAFDKGFVTPEAAHQFASMQDAAYGWIVEHYQNLPPHTRPGREHLAAFSNLFSTYLESSFDLTPNPGQRLYSPDAHCFCPICSWLVDVPYLKTKKLGPADKARAERLKLGFLKDLAHAHQLNIEEASLEGWLKDPDLREAIGLCAYAVDLSRRMQGILEGPASLALWRSFAWTPQGSPKKGY
ncbi:MAG: hypothetical protein KC492_03460, partial [Myxococcales bacterium]|nr:hypothetical protein [Myxococcales bacterium]